LLAFALLQRAAVEQMLAKHKCLKSV